MQAKIELLYYEAIVHYCLIGLTLEQATLAATYGLNLGMAWIIKREPYVVYYN